MEEKTQRGGAREKQKKGSGESSEEPKQGTCGGGGVKNVPTMYVVLNRKLKIQGRTAYSP